MAYVKKEWKDRLSEFAGRRRLVNADTGEETIVDVTRDEGLVSQAGDAFSAANMNDLEKRIEDAVNSAASTGGSAIEIAEDLRKKVTELTAGVSNQRTEINNIKTENSSQDTQINNLKSKIKEYTLSAMTLDDYNKMGTGRPENTLYFCW